MSLNPTYTLEPSFEEMIAYLLQANSTTTAAQTGEARRLWLDFLSTNAALDMFDFSSIANTFSRDKLYANYKAAMSQPDKIMDKERIPIELFAALERCYRERHRTRIRMLAHRAQYASVDGSEVGPLYRSTKGLVERLLWSGAIPPTISDMLQFSTQPAAKITAGQPFQVTVKVLDSSAAVDINNIALIDLTLLNADGATLGGTTRQTASSGVAVFSDLVADSAGEYSLQATASNITGATSNAFSITPAAATKLAFTLQPMPSIIINQPFAVAVEIQDAYENTITSASATVTLLLNNRVGALLSGKKPSNNIAETSAGVVKFTGLTVDKPYSGYTLEATASGLTGAYSTLFTVT